MQENGTTYGELAAILETSLFDLYLKILGIRQWKLTDTVRICCFFNTPDCEQLFRKNLVFFVRN
jgi:hypothetical protein